MQTFEDPVNLPVPLVGALAAVTLDNTTQTIDYFAMETNDDSFFPRIPKQHVDDENNALVPTRTRDLGQPLQDMIGFISLFFHVIPEGCCIWRPKLEWTD